MDDAVILKIVIPVIVSVTGSIFLLFATAWFSGRKEIEARMRSVEASKVDLVRHDESIQRVHDRIDQVQKVMNDKLDHLKDDTGSIKADIAKIIGMYLSGQHNNNN